MSIGKEYVGAAIVTQGHAYSFQVFGRDRPGTRINVCKITDMSAFENQNHLCRRFDATLMQLVGMFDIR